MNKAQAIHIADDILSLYELYGAEDYIGEPVSQMEHMCQCAALAEKSGADDEIILAAFFHDIGHLCEHLPLAQTMDGFGVLDHEKLGAKYLLQKSFSGKIARLVASHVSAKRYLTYKNQGYYDALSEASKKTLEFQGGQMTSKEAARFEMDDLFVQFILLRRWDDQAKTENVPLPCLDGFHTRIVNHLMNSNP